MLLKNISVKSTRWDSESDGVEVLHADEPHALVMAAGYLKFKLARDESEGIYFRGQRKLYKTLPPTLYRDLSNLKAQDKRHVALSDLITKFKNSGNIFKSFGDYSHEPLLQHYGISTTWVDLVDNVWVALWFACHRAMMEAERFLHFERRIPGDQEKYAYILLVAADIDGRNRTKPGYFYGENTELVDLRMAAPSVFLRPHAQHGLLFRKVGKDGSRPIDYSDQIRGIIRVDLAKALDWLGSGKMVNTHSLFPPPYYDSGYRILLTCGVGGNRTVGTISHVGA
ncbi:FRG domain-containing protein [Burkholderia seminalis]|uniref:FRG domain-containing protein n=1 Tax=Burkholderia seminalis TaxID=488731 RepID=UPI00158BE3BD|nr:FRG domain-containing protein [Burkholderia seminalis]